MLAIRSVSRFLWRSLGYCGVCIRTAFWSAIGGWAIYGAAILMSASSLVSISVLVSAVGLTALWTAHVAVYAVKTAIKAQSADPASGGAMVVSSRRRLIAAIPRAALLGAVLIPFPSFAKSCNCTVCTGYDGCCNLKTSGCGCSYRTNVECYLCC